MNSEQARRVLEQTSHFTFVGGRVLITDRQVLAAVAELREEQAAPHLQAPVPLPAPGAAQTSA